MVVGLFLYLRVKIFDAGKQFSSSRFVQHLACEQFCMYLANTLELPSQCYILYC
jgi:hypothetical protein